MNLTTPNVTKEMVYDFTGDILADPMLDNVEKWILVLAAEMAGIGFTLYSDGDNPSTMENMFFAPSGWDGESSTIVLRMDDLDPSNV